MACGNVNKQYLAPTEPKELAEELKDVKIACTLDAKHAGDHSAPYPEQDTAHADQFIFWSDAANVEIKDRKYAKPKDKAAKKAPAEKVPPVEKAAEKSPAGKEK